MSIQIRLGLLGLITATNIGVIESLIAGLRRSGCGVGSRGTCLQNEHVPDALLVVAPQARLE